MRNKVSIMAPVNKVLDYMGSESVDDVPVLMDWAIDADKSIGAKYDYKEVIRVLDIVNCRAVLPCGTVEVNGLLLGDHGCDCGLLFDQGQIVIRGLSTDIETTTGFVAIDIVSDVELRCSATQWYVQDNNVVLDTNYDGNKVTVRLLMYQLDNDGFPLVNENNVEAIAAYLEWRTAARSKWSKDKRDVMPANSITEMENRWERLCADARAQSGMPSPAEKADISDLLSNPISGRSVMPESNA